jgi:hypothetical protein
VFVRAIEIALDLYSHGNARHTLAQLAFHIYKFVAKVADPKNQRIISPQDNRVSVERARAELRNFLAGKTLCIGNPGGKSIPAGHQAQRIYVKTIDHGQELPPELHRAR